MEYKLVSDVAGDVITQQLKLVTEETEFAIATWIADTRELQFMKVLSELGWTSPDYSNNVLDMLAWLLHDYIHTIEPKLVLGCDVNELTIVKVARAFVGDRDFSDFASQHLQERTVKSKE